MAARVKPLLRFGDYGFAILSLQYVYNNIRYSQKGDHQLNTYMLQKHLSTIK